MALTALITTAPANTLTGVPVNEKITVTFSEAMDPRTINVTTFTLCHGTQAVTGTVTYSGTTAVFSPTHDLEPNILYSGSITTGAKDTAGIGLTGDYRWNFITQGAVDTRLPIMNSAAQKPKGLHMGVAGNSSFNSVHNPSNLSAERPDSNTPRGRIYEVASLMFAEYGFRGTSTRAIAEAAGVKQVMIHYY
jgi:hypothetical protein